MKVREVLWRVGDLLIEHDSLLAKSKEGNPTALDKLKECQEEITRIEEMEIVE